MTTHEDAPPPSSLTLARTGTIKGVPAMIAFDGSKRTVLLVQEGAGWKQEREVQYGGIRGMGLLAKYLDEDSARRADQTPVFEEGKAAPEAKAPKAAPAPKAPPVTLADVNPAPEARAAMDKVVSVKRTRKAKAPVAPKVEAPAAPPAPVGPVPDAAIVAHLGMERAVQVAAMTDLGALRTLRESVIKAGAPAEVVRAITLRAGEIACGFTLAGVRGPRAATKAAEKALTPVKVNTDGADPYALLAAAAPTKGENERFNAEEILAFGFPPSASKHPTYWMSTGTPRARLAQHGYAASLHPVKGLLLRKV